MLALEVPVRIVDSGTDWAAWITAIATAITGGVVLGTAIAAVLALRDAKRTRHGLLITEISTQWADPLVRESLTFHGTYPERGIIALVDKLLGPTEEKPTEEEFEAFKTLSVLANLIESMGVLVDEKAMTNDVIYKMWGGPIMTAWDAWDEAVGKMRVYDDEPDTFQYFEALALAMREISEERKQQRERHRWSRRGRSTSAGAYDPQAGAKAPTGTNEQ